MGLGLAVQAFRTDLIGQWVGSELNELRQLAADVASQGDAPGAQRVGMRRLALDMPLCVEKFCFGIPFFQQK